MGTATETTTATRATGTESLLGEMFSTRLYKPSQGRIARQVTCGAIWIVVALGAWRWFDTAWGIGWIGSYIGDPDTRNSVASVLQFLLPSLLLLAGVWIGFRLVSYPRFADFLIAVEAEMNKVTWPSQDELVRSSVVVILLLAAFTLILFVFDIMWVQVFTWLGIR
jgi:preprotein translocase subunit SecE